MPPLITVAIPADNRPEELSALLDAVQAQEGVRFDLLAAPLEVLGDAQGWVRALRCIRMARRTASRATPSWPAPSTPWSCPRRS